MRYLIGTSAAVALAASMVQAQPNNGNGADRAKGKPAVAQMKGSDKAEKTAKQDRVKNARRDKADRQRANADRKLARQRDAADRTKDRNFDRMSDRETYRERDRDNRFAARPNAGLKNGFVDGCPPGLAKKNNNCLPPGQAKAREDRFFDRADFFGLRDATDARYRYNDGMLLRLGQNGGVSGYLPLLGGALAVGNQWPSYYDSRAAPDYFRDYYDLGGSDNYRMADNVIYRLDPETAAISSIAALLTGDDFVVGQPLPDGYSAYNVPYNYRDRYADGPDAQYRYADGYIYRVDPQTRLIAEAIDLLV